MKLVNIGMVPRELIRVIEPFLDQEYDETRGEGFRIPTHCHATYIFTDKDGRDKILTGLTTLYDFAHVVDAKTGEVLLTSNYMGVVLAGKKLGIKLPLIEIPKPYDQLKRIVFSRKSGPYFAVYDIREIDKGIVKAIFWEQSPLGDCRKKRVFSCGFKGDFKTLPDVKDNDNFEFETPKNRFRY